MNCDEAVPETCEPRFLSEPGLLKIGNGAKLAFQRVFERCLDCDGGALLDSVTDQWQVPDCARHQ